MSCHETMRLIRDPVLPLVLPILRQSAALVWRAFYGLGTLGVLWGFLLTTLICLSSLFPVVAGPLHFLMLYSTPLLASGMIWAIREVDQGRQVQPQHLFAVWHEHRIAPLTLWLLPQILMVFVVSMWLVWLLGPDQIIHLSQVLRTLQTSSIAQSTAQPIASLFQGLPLWRLLIWLLVSLFAYTFVSFLTSLMLPQVLFSAHSGHHALWHSLRLGLRHWLAMALLVIAIYILYVIFYFVLATAMSILAMLIGPIVAFGLMQLIFMATFVPFLCAIIYTTWLVLLTTDHSAPPPDPRSFYA